MPILVIDNYDSFTYNLVHYLEQVTDAKVNVFRNDQITLEQAGAYTKILMSPGPGIPSEAGLLMDLVRKYSSTHDIFGVCLGLQAIGEVFGGKLRNLDRVYHGVATEMRVLKDDILFNGIPKTFMAGRYHSWVIDEKTLPACLEITAEDENHQIMAVRHKKFNVRGVQFHPESVLTKHGLEMIKNWALRK